MFVDSSTILAIIGQSAEAPLLVEKIKGSRRPCKTSAGVRVDVVMALARSRADRRGVTGEGIERAGEIFDELLRVLKIYEITISPRISADACALAGRFGHLTDHPAQLRMRHCLALAAAESLRYPLLTNEEAFDRINERDMEAWRRGE